MLAIVPDIILCVIENLQEKRLFIKLEKEIVMNNSDLEYANSNFFIRTNEKVEKPKNYRIYPSSLFQQPVMMTNIVDTNTQNNSFVM